MIVKSDILFSLSHQRLIMRNGNIAKRDNLDFILYGHGVVMIFSKPEWIIIQCYYFNIKQHKKFIPVLKLTPFIKSVLQAFDWPCVVSV